MQIVGTQTPTYEIAKRIERIIGAHPTSTILCLTAGGSALEIFEHLYLSDEQKVRTIFCMGDERWSREADINNFLQLQQRVGGQVHSYEIVDTSVHDDEDLEKFSARLSSQISKIISEADDLKIISILGIGTDGHTASIFPLPEEAFQAIYLADATYAPVHLKTLRIDSRASLTPDWILKHVDYVVGYAVGATKTEIVNELIQTNKSINEMPAQLIKQHPRSYLYTDTLNNTITEPTAQI